MKKKRDVTKCRYCGGTTYFVQMTIDDTEVRRCRRRSCGRGLELVESKFGLVRKYERVERGTGFWRIARMMGIKVPQGPRSTWRDQLFGKNPFGNVPILDVLLGPGASGYPEI